jgi:hypothetical protein
MAPAAFLCVLTLASACSREEKSAKEAEEPPVIQAAEGMKYYVGGPVMKYDDYGRLRLGGFSGEVAAPISRGLLIGYKVEPDGKHFEYRTWINGRAVSKSTGFLDGDGLLWFTNRETFDAAGKVVARHSYEYDDEKKSMVSTLQQIDPATGEIVNTAQQEIPYTPPEDIEDEEEEEEGENVQE